MKMLTEFIEIQTPVISAVKCPELAAMNENQILTPTSLEVSRPYAA
jgi:hypothetical protein